MAPSAFETHDVYNQPPQLPVRNVFETDPILYGALETALDETGERLLSEHGGFWGTAEARELARLANAHPPQLRTHDGQGRRIDLVEYHPAYHALMRRSAEAGLGISIWQSDREDDSGRAHAMRSARLYMTAQTECSHLVPWTTTCAAAGIALVAPEFAEPWMSRIAGRRYDHRPQPAASKAGLTLSLALTEKQGSTPGVDNLTQASRFEGRRYRLIGHKWAVSGPMADALIVLADAAGGPSVFLVPRFRRDESLNRVRIQRLKDTVGLRGNGIAEVEFADAEAHLIGAEGDGAKLVADAHLTLRHDAAVMATGVMRGALANAVHHVRHRASGGTRLLDKPLMARVLADMAIDVAAATALVIRLANARDRAGNDVIEDAIARLMIPVAKFWIGRVAPMIAAEALECQGINGYTESSEAARAYRDAQAFGIWGGASNQLALEALSMIESVPEALDAVLGDVTAVLGREASASAEAIRGAANACMDDPGSARIFVEQLAITTAAAALHRFAPRAITDAFIDTRLAGGWRASYGMLDARFDARGIVDYTYPAS
ncbi:acyl-CoA dehydrogenase family protein [Prosthecomicrobium hirschii]|uniref:acyl-CoA dehydrogenase family protein n=1 Tax=Prosthecodimorpha hirschii TaxID=665126 RepID=UPI00221F3591|nr:acyl-CoA dehydrogenase family protein [Prosthecomicrobium hirschii]MCW1839149.1 acyl-CoA dehydrogenase family protein [Prosthecomicrobium hirschii]